MVKLMSPSKFAELMPALTARLTNDLEREQQDCALPDLGIDPLWDTPAVDSKTVAKLSPAVKELTGQPLDPRWIQRGGYNTVAEAVGHIVSQIKLNRVAPADAPVPTPVKEVAAVAH